MPHVSAVRRIAAVLTLAAVLFWDLSAQTSPTQPRSQPPKCTDNGTYVNSKGQTVKRPENCPAAPEGATARCRDGTYSFSRSRRAHVHTMTEWQSGCEADLPVARFFLKFF